MATKSTMPSLDEAFELPEDYLQGPVASALRPGLIEATDRATGEDRTLKVWHKTGTPADAELRELWRHERLQVERVMSYPGADGRWQELIDQGNDDLVFTCGIFHTDLTEHTMTKVPGEGTFSLNIGGTKNEVMAEFHKNICETSEILASTHNVRFDFGRRVGTPAVELDKSVLALVEKAGKDIGFAPILMPTVGHDAAMFQRREIPTSVLLIRNSGGSHNPKEHMEISDFQVGVKVLGATICNILT